MKKMYQVLQEFDRSVVIDIYLCGVSMGAALAAQGLDADCSHEHAGEIADSVVKHLTDDPLSMEAIRAHILEHLKGAASEQVPGVPR